MVKKIFKALYIVQEVSNEQRHKQGLKRLGKGYFKAYRFNPYNPLSYIVLPIKVWETEFEKKYYKTKDQNLKARVGIPYSNILIDLSQYEKALKLP